MGLIILRKACISLLVFVLIFSSSCAVTPGFNTEQTEKNLSKSYVMQGKLIYDSEKYDVELTHTDPASIVAEGQQTPEYKIAFKSGDITNGLTVEFFEEGVFLYFDDLRFKSNGEFFTSLASLKKALNIFARPDTKKETAVSQAATGMELYEITHSSDEGTSKLFISASDSIPLRLETNIDGTSLTLDISKFQFIEG